MVIRSLHRVRTGLIGLSLILFVALAPVDHATAQDATCRGQRTKIVGGSVARLSDWPGQAALRLYSAPSSTALYFCGGTAISDRWVLTAAHCLPDFRERLSGTFRDSRGAAHPAVLEVVLGAQDLRNVSVDHVYAVDRVIIHENYRQSIERAMLISDDVQRETALDEISQRTGDDIALVRLARSWEGPRARLSLSAATDPAVPPRTQVRVAGFGRTKANRAGLTPSKTSDGKGELLTGSPLLLETGIEAVSQQQCAARYPQDLIGRGQLCAGLDQGGKDSCQGDSGGPLVSYGKDGCPKQIGVVSWGVGCGEKDDEGAYFGVYTRISSYAEWIQKHTGPLQGANRLMNITGTELNENQLGEAIQQLEALLGPSRGKVTIGLQGGNRIKLGGTVAFEAQTEVEGRLVIMDIDANRSVTLIYPNKYVSLDDIGRIRAREKVSIPGPHYSGFSVFRATEPTGKGLLVAIVVPEDFPIDRVVAERALVSKGLMPVADPPSYLMRFIRQIENRLRAESRPPGEIENELRKWGLGITEYEIVP